MIRSNVFVRLHTASIFDVATSRPGRVVKTSIWQRLVEGMMASRARSASQIALPYLANLDDEELLRLGHSSSEIRDLRALAARGE